MPTNEDTTTHNGERDAPRGRVLVASAVLVATVVLLTVFVAWPAGTSDDNAQSSPTTSTTTRPVAAKTGTTTKSEAAPEELRGCSGLPASSDPPVKAPKTTWTLYHGIALPSSPELGPTKVEGDVARCFAHSPVGAVVAGYTITTRYLVGPEGTRVVKEQTTPGPGQRKLLAALAAEGPITDIGGFCQLTGYRILSYTPATAVVQTVARCGSGSLQATDLTLRWNGDDWLVQLLLDGAPGGTSALVDMTGITAWKGVG